MTTNPADVSVQFIDEVPAPPREEDVPEDQIQATVSRPGPARSAPAQMPAMDGIQDNMQDNEQGNLQDNVQDHLQMHPAASTPMGPDATPPLGPVSTAAVLEQPDFGISGKPCHPCRDNIRRPEGTRCSCTNQSTRTR